MCVSLLSVPRKLPHAAQTHEVCFEPVTRTVLVSQMSNSVLVRIPVGDDGLLLDDQDAWRVGESDPATSFGLGGLHNVSLSPANPGCVWLSLQYANTLVLLDVRTMEARAVLRVPTLHRRERRGEGAGGEPELVKIGGPHCVRECAVTGHLWVCLKGAVACHPAPAATAEEQAGSGAPARLKRLNVAMRRACCNPDALKRQMAALDARADADYDCPPPEGFAIWRVDPSAYDPDAADGARGGTLYACLASPPMCAVDARGNCFVAQDQQSSILRIDAATGACAQLEVPMAEACGETLRIAGPAIGIAPDGAVWCTLLGHHAGVVRVDPATLRMTLHNVGGPEWCKSLRLIHFAFDRDGAEEDRQMYLLASDLLDERSVNALVVLRFARAEDPADAWTRVVGRRVLPLPTQDCSCHRVALVAPGELAPALRSVVVTEMASSKLLQVKPVELTAEHFFFRSNEHTALHSCGPDPHSCAVLRNPVAGSSTSTTCARSRARNAGAAAGRTRWWTTRSWRRRPGARREHVVVACCVLLQ